MLTQMECLTQTINDHYRQFTGTDLPSPEKVHDLVQWLDNDAPYSLLAHRMDGDPCFIYANQCALDCFKYNATEIVGLPSRFSAPEDGRAERQQLLERVLRDGIAYPYSGVRIDKHGELFTIYDGVVWQLRNIDGQPWGQAALFWPTENNRPGWYKPLL